MTLRERITGQEAIINVPTSESEISVTNVSFSIDTSTTDVQTNRSLKPTHAVTGLRYSGSFEYDGADDEVRNRLFITVDQIENGDDGIDQSKEVGEPLRFNMTVKENDPETGNEYRTWTLENVIVTGMSRDIPGDDVSSTSWDFDAEDAYVSSVGTAEGSTGRSTDN